MLDDKAKSSALQHLKDHHKVYVFGVGHMTREPYHHDRLLLPIEQASIGLLAAVLISIHESLRPERIIKRMLLFEMHEVPALFNLDSLKHCMPGNGEV